MNQDDINGIKNLAQEGKEISRIRDEDYPDYEYWEIYGVVYDDGGKSARGVKKMISNRLNALAGANMAERRKITQEIRDLVWHLYNSLKSNQKKLDAIRKTLGDN